MIFPGSRAEDLALLPTHPEWQSLFDTYGALPRHASQLYELALEGVVLFLILNPFIRKPRPTGSVSGLFPDRLRPVPHHRGIFRQPDAQFTGGWVQYISMGQILSIPDGACGYHYDGLGLPPPSAATEFLRNHETVS